MKIDEGSEIVLENKEERGREVSLARGVKGTYSQEGGGRVSEENLK